jgi:hypothetical protein
MVLIYHRVLACFKIDVKIQSEMDKKQESIAIISWEFDGVFHP